MSSADIVIEVVFFLGVILIVAKVFGEIFERYLKQPSVLGELIAGMVIGPFALGRFIGIRPATEGALPIMPELNLIANIGAVILLFFAGIETDLKQFIKYGFSGGMVGIGGVVLPFAFGYFVITMFYTGPNVFNVALFTGAILTATSVGISVRVLKDVKKLNSPEGTTILSAAVIDDILGIVILAIVIGIAGVAGAGSGMDIAFIIIKAMVFWVILLVIALKFSEPLVRLLRHMKSEGAFLVMVLAFGFLVAYISAWMGLALIIGAYAAGLALSPSVHKAHMLEKIEPIYHFLVPVFFVSMGMMTDVTKLGEIGYLGILLIVLAIVGKLAGSGIAAFFTGFNSLGAARVGVGMIPRGEVGLIIAYYGLLYLIIDQSFYNIVVVMTIVTTILPPPILKMLYGKKFEDREGCKLPP